MGLFDGDPTAEWTASAYALRLPLCPLTKAVEPASGPFEGIRRSLGPAGQGGGHPDTHWMAGKRAEIDFAVGGRTEVEGSGEERRVRVYTHWAAEIDPPLWLGLRVELDRGGLMSQLFETDKPRFAAWDEGRLRDLFAYRANDGRDPYEILGTAYQQGLRATVDDHGVRFTANKRILDAPSIGSLIDGATLIAERLRAARARLGPARWEIDAAQAWSMFAGRHALTFDRERFQASGTAEGSRMDVRLLGTVIPVTRLRLRFLQPLAVAVRITVGPPPGVLSKILGAQDIELGDPQFDPYFVVQGQPEQGVRQLVGAEMRRHLVAIAARGAGVTLQSDRLELRVQGMLMKAEALEALAAEALGVVRAFWRP